MHCKEFPEITCRQTHLPQRQLRDQGAGSGERGGPAVWATAARFA